MLAAVGGAVRLGEWVGIGNLTAGVNELRPDSRSDRRWSTRDGVCCSLGGVRKISTVAWLIKTAYSTQHTRPTVFNARLADHSLVAGRGHLLSGTYRERVHLSSIESRVSVVV